MSIKLTPEANKRLAVYRLHDAAAFDALRRLLVRIDEKPNSGALLASVRDLPPGLPTRLDDCISDYVTRSRTWNSSPTRGFSSKGCRLRQRTPRWPPSSSIRKI